MRGELPSFWALLIAFETLFSVALGLSLEPREQSKRESQWAPKTKSPHFFNLRVNDRCDPKLGETTPEQCPFDGYAIRLEHGILIATPYNRWWDAKLPTFFVDDDTKMYTVSKDPLQIYIDSTTGAVKYTKVGWVPPSAISEEFHHLGSNPLQRVDPTSAWLTWPETMKTAQDSKWWLCELGEGDLSGTGQWQLFVNPANWKGSGVKKTGCQQYELAAINANPWKKQYSYYHAHQDDNEHQ